MHGSLLAVLVVSVLLAAIGAPLSTCPLRWRWWWPAWLASTIPGFTRHRARTRTRALRAAAAAAVVGGPGEQLCRRCAEQPAADRAARGRACRWRRRSRSASSRIKTVPELTVAAALTLGAIVAPPDAVSATAVGRRLGLPRQIMTLLGGESLLNDATALTAYKVALAAAIGAAATWGSGLGDVRRWRRAAASWSASCSARHRLRPMAARRSVGGERRRAGRAVRHLSGRRGGARLRCARRRGRRAHPRPAVVRTPATRPGCRTTRCGRPCSWCWSRSRS